MLVHTLGPELGLGLGRARLGYGLGRAGLGLRNCASRYNNNKDNIITVIIKVIEALMSKYIK